MSRARFELPDAVTAFLSAPRPMLVGPDWRAGAGAPLSVENPANGEVIGTVATAGPADIDAAVQAARCAFDDKRWRGLAPAARAAILWRVSELLLRHAEELATLETLENGKPLVPMRAQELPFAAECFRYHAGWCTKLAGAAQPLAGAADAEFMAYTRREPVGVCALIVPWNGPLVQAAWKLAPALAAGCSVVLKPAELTPLATLRLAELLLEAGVPPGVVNVVNGTGAEVGAALARHPDVNKVSFTGSTAVGRELAAAVGADLKRLTLELGGKSPCIVFADADLDKAIPGVAAAIFANAGQVCVAGSRLYVERAVYGEVLSGVAAIAGSLKLGPGLDPDTEMGPLISSVQRDRVAGHLAVAMEEGARVVTGGRPVAGPGYFMQPTVIDNAGRDSRIVQEEVFGPVLVASRFEDEAAALAEANATRYGLAASIWTRDIGRAHRLAAEINAGLVWINSHGRPDMAVPFGGFNASGWGRENGYEGLLGYTELKSVMVDIGS